MGLKRSTMPLIISDTVFLELDSIACLVNELSYFNLRRAALQNKLFAERHIDLRDMLLFCRS